MSTLPDGERIAKLEVEFQHLSKTVDEMSLMLKEIKSTLSEAKGGWRTLMLLGGMVSAIGGFIGWVLSRFNL